MFATILLYLVEVSLRIAGVQAAYDAGAFGSWRMTPGMSGAPLRGPRDQHDFRATTNADGLRTKLGRERTPGRLRVALMGDSTVFGWGVDDGGTVSDGLQEALEQQVPGRVEVLNAGQPGYSTTQVAWLVGKVVAAYQPDLLIAFVPMHDFNRVLISDRELLEGGAGPVADLRVWMARNSRIYQVLRRSIWPMTEQAMLLPDQRTGEPRVERVSDTERTRNFDDMKAALAGHNGKVGVGFLPFHADLIGQAADRLGMGWAKEWTSKNGAPLFDARACCGTNSGDLVLADDYGHLNARGNLAVGASLASGVRAALGI